MCIRDSYKGILCLESTLGWGLIALLLFVCLHRWVVGAALLIPPALGVGLAFALVCAYGIDFAFSVRRAIRRAQEKAALPVQGTEEAGS